MDLRKWNEDFRYLKSMILKEEYFNESMKLICYLHTHVHLSDMSQCNERTFEDELWDNLDEHTFRYATNEKGRTIAYGLWHSSRIEDMTMNMLVADEKQVFESSNWKDKLNTTIIDTGNALSSDEILEFSQKINMEALRNYRIAVGKKLETSSIISNFLT